MPHVQRWETKDLGSRYSSRGGKPDKKSCRGRKIRGYTLLGPGAHKHDCLYRGPKGGELGKNDLRAIKRTLRNNMKPTYKVFWDTVKAMLGGVCVAWSAHIREKEKFKVGHLCFHLRILHREWQAEFKVIKEK